MAYYSSSIIWSPETWERPGDHPDVVERVNARGHYEYRALTAKGQRMLDRYSGVGGWYPFVSSKVERFRKEGLKVHSMFELL